MIQLGSKTIDSLYLGSKIIKEAYIGNKKIWPDEISIPSAIKDSMVLWYDIKRQGCTNESMADNPVLTDLSGNGYDATCYNFAWDGTSGIGTDDIDFTEEYPNSYYGGVEITSNLITAYARDVVGAKYTNITKDTPTFTVKITGLTDGINNGEVSDIRFYYKRSSGIESAIIAASDGIYTIPASYNTINGSGVDHCISIRGDSAYGTALSTPITIELYSYPNALVSDGVDDYARVTGLPIMTVDKGYTVIVRRQWIDTSFGDDHKTFISKRLAPGSMDGAFTVEKINTSKYMQSVSFGSWHTIPDITAEIGTIYQTSVSYNGVTTLNTGSMEDTDTLNIFRYRDADGEFSSVALYSLLIFDRDLTTEEIEWVIKNLIDED